MMISKKQPEPNVEKIYPLTSLQAGILSSSRLYGNSMYVLQKRITLSGFIDMEIMNKTVECLIKRYEVLRTFIVIQKLREPMQAVLRDRYLEVPVLDIREEPEKEREAYICQYLKNDRNSSFDLSKDMLIRLAIVRTEDKTYEMLWTFHHIITDGWSTGILLNDFIQIYSDIKNNRVVDKEKRISYDNYVKWRRVKSNMGMEYWKDYLEGYESHITIEGKDMDAGLYQYQSAKHAFIINSSITEELVHLAKKNDITLNTVLETIWGILIQKYSYANDIVYGYVSSGRNAELENIHSMIGLFINTVPLRIQAEKGNTFIQLAKQVSNNYLEAQEHEYNSLTEIQKNTSKKRGLINHIMVFENYPFDGRLNHAEAVADRGFEILGLVSEEQTNYDLNVVICPSEQIEVELLYNRNIFNEEDIINIQCRLISIIEQIIQNPNIKWEQISIAAEKELEQINKWSVNSETVYPKHVCVQEIFEERVQEYSEETAVADQGQIMTYRELDYKSNQIGYMLRKAGVKPNQYVGICMDKTADLAAGILGILKAGGAYVPIDPSYPNNRICYIIEQAEIKILLTDHNIAGLEQQVSIWNMTETDMSGVNGDRLEIVNKPDDTAYVIFTSGTTGKPKGVMIPHKNIIRLLFNDKFSFQFSHRDAWTMFHSSCFDFSVWEMYGALLYGGKLVMVSKEQSRSPREFLNLIENEKVTVLNQVPSSLYNLIHYDNRAMPSIRYLITGGEALQPEKLIKFRDINPQIKIINMYGITETTVHTTYKEITELDIRAKLSNIGTPLPTLDVYIMNEDTLCGIGITGEICVAGEGLAKGYINNTELTNLKFVNSPLLGKKIYKSGDLGRWLPNGEIEYIGRGDSQIKVRGYRIELGEIEQVIIDQDQVDDSVVLTKNDQNGDKYILAFLIGEGLDLEKIKKGIREKLPEYMMPRNLYLIEKLPTTKNGKIDKEELLNLDMNQDRKHIPAESEIQKRLSGLFKEVLNIDRLSIDDNYFEIGGHSLNATILESRIVQEFNADVPLVQIFKTPTVLELANYIEEEVRNKKIKEFDIIQKREKLTLCELSLLQESIWSAIQMGSSNKTMNIVFPLKMVNVDLDILRQAIEAILIRHQSLRTQIVLVQGIPMQKILPFSGEMSRFHYEDLTEYEDIEGLVREIIKLEKEENFEVIEHPLMRLKIKKTGSKEYLFLFSMHHIISDAWSMDILSKDLMNNYCKLCEGKTSQPEEIDIQYTDFAVWQKECLNSKESLEKREYWKNILKYPIPVLKLPTDFERPNIKDTVGKSIDFKFEGKMVQKLKRRASDNQGTLFMSFLTASYILFHRYTGQKDIIIGTPIAGRDHAQVKQIVGYFLNIIPLRINISVNDNYDQLFSKVKEITLGAYSNQSYPFSSMLKEISYNRDSTRSPLFDVMVQHINTDNQKKMKFGDGEMELLEVESTQSKYDLVFNFMESKDGIILRLEYSTGLFKEGTVKRLLDRYNRILEYTLANPLTEIGKIELEEKSDYLSRVPLIRKQGRR